MDQLNLLCALDDHYNLLLDYENEKEDLSDRYSNELNNSNSLKLEENINLINEKNEKVKEKLDEVERSLKEYNYTVKEMEDKLYSGNINDIKQLEALSEEKENLKRTIAGTETQVLEYMEETEMYENKLTDIKAQLDSILNQNHDNELKYEKIDKSLFTNIDEVKKNIEKAKLHIDEELLIKYERIRKNRRSGIAKMKNGVCLGCNMGISTRMVENIKSSNDIICCENCGRILCKQTL